MSQPRYTVIIQWSDEDQVYVVSLPEWGGCKTHGETYEEAAKNAREVLELLMDTQAEHETEPLPEARLFHYPGADVVDLPERRTLVKTTRAPRQKRSKQAPEKVAR